MRPFKRLSYGGWYSLHDKRSPAELRTVDNTSVQRCLHRRRFKSRSSSRCWPTRHGFISEWHARHSRHYLTFPPCPRFSCFPYFHLYQGNPRPFLSYLKLHPPLPFSSEYLSFSLGPVSHLTLNPSYPFLYFLISLPLCFLFCASQPPPPKRFSFTFS